MLENQEVLTWLESFRDVVESKEDEEANCANESV